MRPVAELTGDRACTVCGFNLHGQQIVREPHYGMLMVRCPECASVAALQEYPSLGRWAGRLSFLAAALFIAIVLGLFVGSSAALAGMSSELGSDGYRELAREIATRHKAYQASRPAGGAGATAFPYASSLNGWEYDSIELAWWDAQDAQTRQGMTKAIAGPWRIIEGKNAVAMGSLMLFAVAVGAFWSVVLSAVSRFRVWIFAIMLAAGGGFFLLVFSFDRYGSLPGSTVAYELAREYLGIGQAWIVLGALIAGVAVGLLIGRTIVRWIVRVLIQPRHRGLFGFLWTCDGLRMPATRPRGTAGT